MEDSSGVAVELQLYFTDENESRVPFDSRTTETGAIVRIFGGAVVRPIFTVSSILLTFDRIASQVGFFQPLKPVRFALSSESSSFP